ncbi:unnamed protein product [Schistocephalus solidus]|uniref:Aquaporin NIP4-1 n=1 Tax=Schistocephalus solidus TaxID=70667 RepID=A0A183SKA5_SCHSO|nr:unnamed protein product [Schistocephalus solidus]
MNLKPKMTLAYNWFMFRIFFAELVASILVTLPAMLEDKSKKYEALLVALSSGAAYYVSVWITYPTSAAHINPIVSFSVFMNRKIRIGHLIIYWSAQMLGCIFSTYLALYMAPYLQSNVKNCMTIPANGVSDAQALSLEIVISFTFILVYLSTIDDERPENWALSSGVNMALALMLIYTSNLMVSMFVVGPLTGAVGAVIVYDLLLMNVPVDEVEE